MTGHASAVEDFLLGLELRHLRVFLAVIKYGGITRAARRMHIAQSAVSQAIKQLERECGIQLLERRPDGVRPTPAGEQLAHHARRILDAVEVLEGDMASYRGHAKGVVSVGVMSSIAVLLMGPLIRSVDRELPDVSLRVQEGVADELLEALRLERLDLVVLLSPIDAEELPVVHTGDLPLSIVVAPDHPLADRGKVALADLAEEAWVAFPAGNPGRRWLDDNARQAGFRPLVGAEVETLVAFKAFVEAGRGIGLLPPDVVGAETRADRLRTIRVVDPVPMIHHGYTFDPRRSGVAAAEVRRVLEAELRRLGEA